MDARLRPADDRQKHRRSQTDQTALDRNIDAQSLTEAVDFENHNQSLPREPVPLELPVILQRTGRYIFIAGAATDGECVLYDGEAGTYERLPLSGVQPWKS